MWDNTMKPALDVLGLNTGGPVSADFILRPGEDALNFVKMTLLLVGPN